MNIKLIETDYQDNIPVMCCVVNNYTIQTWWREYKHLQKYKDKGILDFEDVLDLEKGECERKVWY